jgi:hypothetical protein
VIVIATCPLLLRVVEYARWMILFLTSCVDPRMPRKRKAAALSGRSIPTASSYPVHAEKAAKLYDCYSIQEELELAKAAAARAPPPPPPPPGDDVKGKANKKPPSFNVSLCVDIEGRSAWASAGPPSAIAAVSGVMEKGQYGSVGNFKVKMLMPKGATWEPECAEWTLRKDGGGGASMIERDAKDAVAPVVGLRRFKAFVEEKQTKYKHARLVGDAISYDFAHLDHWLEVACDGIRPLQYRMSTRGFRPPRDVVKEIISTRKRNKLPPYDPDDDDALYPALEELGFKHDHDPLNDAECMYAGMYIQSFYETAKTKDKDGKVTKREYDVEKLRKDGILPGAVEVAD